MTFISECSFPSSPSGLVFSAAQQTSNARCHEQGTPRFAAVAACFKHLNLLPGSRLPACRGRYQLTPAAIDFFIQYPLAPGVCKSAPVWPRRAEILLIAGQHLARRLRKYSISVSCFEDDIFILPACFRDQNRDVRLAEIITRGWKISSAATCNIKESPERTSRPMVQSRFKKSHHHLRMAK